MKVQWEIGEEEEEAPIQERTGAIMAKWKSSIPGFPEYDAYELAHKIEDCYKKHNAPIKIHKSGPVPFYGNGYKFAVNLEQSEAPVGKIERIVDDIQFTLHLPALKAIRENGVLYLVTSGTDLTLKNNNLLQIIASDKYKSVFEKMKMAHPVGVSENGDVMICDLEDYPHAMVSGTTKSGKSTALKCLLASLLKYPPDKMNFLVADRGVELNKFRDLPHLSSAIIHTPEDLAYALLLLHDEMERRNELIRESQEDFSVLPYIVCIVDEFPWFIDAIKGNKQTEKVVKAINDILRFGRNTKIHIVLSIHDPKDDIAIIEKGDLPVSLVFQTANTRKSMNVLDGAGAQKLKGRGDMNFRYHGETHHLQGVYITDEEIAGLVQFIIEQSEYDSQFPRGRYGFSISNKDIEEKRAEAVRYITNFSTEMDNSNKYNDKDLKFAQVVLWVLSQACVSVNLIQTELHVANKYADKFFKDLKSYEVIGDITEKGRRKVTPKSIEDIPDELKEFLSRQGITDDKIKEAIEKREASRP